MIKDTKEIFLKESHFFCTSARRIFFREYEFLWRVIETTTLKANTLHVIPRSSSRLRHHVCVYPSTSFPQGISFHDGIFICMWVDLFRMEWRCPWAWLGSSSHAHDPVLVIPVLVIPAGNLIARRHFHLHVGGFVRDEGGCPWAWLGAAWPCSLDTAGVTRAAWPGWW